jgi:hypothetical protein
MFRLRPFLWFCALAACLSGLGEASAWATENPAQPAQRKTTQSESYVMIEPIYASILDGTKAARACCWWSSGWMCRTRG